MGLYKLYKIFQDFLFNSINAYDTFFQADNIKLSDFCQMNKFDHLILKPTCFKGLLPSTIDISLTNNKLLWDRMCTKKVSETTTRWSSWF